MAGGLVALFDDVAVLARAAAASVDDIGAAAGRASAKAAVKAAVMTEDVARTVHLSRQLGEPLPISEADVTSLWERYQNAYGQK